MIYIEDEDEHGYSSEVGLVTEVGKYPYYTYSATCPKGQLITEGERLTPADAALEARTSILEHKMKVLMKDQQHVT